MTLRDAADYIVKLPKAEQNLEAWQTAVEALLMAAEDRGPLMHARIGMLRALNRNVVRVFNPDRKDKHWGEAQAGEGPMTPRILIGMIIAFEPIAVAAAAPPAAQMQYPGQSCDRWEQECTKLNGPQTERWYECMNQPRAKYDCYSAWDLTPDRRPSRTPVHAQQRIASTD